MYRCHQCGATLKPEMRFCPQCGLAFNQAVPPESQQQISTPPIQQVVTAPIDKPHLQLINWQWFGEAWKLFNAAPGIWISSVIIPGVPGLLGYGIIAGLKNLNSTAGGLNLSSQGTVIVSVAMLIALVLVCVSVVLRVLFNYSTSAIANKQVRGERVSLRDLFRADTNMWPVLGFSIIYMVAFCVGLLALYVGAILVVAFLTPAVALVADGIPLSLAIERSYNAMKRDPLNSILFALAWNLLILVSVIPCGLGILVALPVVHILMALVYRDAIKNI